MACCHPRSAQAPLQGRMVPVCPLGPWLIFSGSAHLVQAEDQTYGHRSQHAPCQGASPTVSPRCLSATLRCQHVRLGRLSLTPCWRTFGSTAETILAKHTPIFVDAASRRVWADVSDGDSDAQAFVFPICDVAAGLPPPSGGMVAHDDVPRLKVACEVRCP